MNIRTLAAIWAAKFAGFACKKLGRQGVTWAGKIALNAPIAVRLSKKMINEGLALPIAEAVAMESALFGGSFETHDQVEGMSCFLSKEKPKPKAVFTNN